MSKTKSDKFKKLEQELADLEQWLDLGLVPKKDLVKHTAEIKSLKERIEEEKAKLAETKDGNEPEEYSAPKRGAKQSFADQSNIPDVDVADDSSEEEEEEDLGSDDSYITDEADADEDTDDIDALDDEDEDPFSDRNRWRRGVLEDPDSDNW